MSWISEAIAQVKNLEPGFDPLTNDIQFYLLVIQVLWAVLVAFIAYFVRQLNKTLSDIMAKYEKMNERLHEEYAKKEEVRERVHGLRDALGIHSTWIHILAQKAELNLPQMGRKDDSP